MIPKIIHYCWFGKNKKSKEIIDCINSWKKFLPDYEFIEWNEINSDLNHNFVKYFYQKKKWAFVADYVRLKVLSDYGGIYLDTDMLLVKNLDPLLDCEFFFGAENDDYISAGVIGAQKNNIFINNCLQMYNDINYTKEITDITIPKIITALFTKKYNLKSFNKVIRIDNIVIYNKDYFYPFPMSEKREPNKINDYITSETYAVHLWLGSWVENQEFYYIKKRKYWTGLKIIFARNNKKLEYQYIKKILSSIKESILIK